MYDSPETEMTDKAIALIVSIKSALEGGTKHFRKSDGKLLTTEREIIEAMIDEGGIFFKPAINKVSKED